MPGRHRQSKAQPLALIVGGALGALLRFALASQWPQPRALLVTTVLTVGIAFLVASYVLASGSRSLVASLVLGLCASAASLSAWAVLTISQTMKISLALLTVTPAAAICGLLGGLVVARAVAR